MAELENQGTGATEETGKTFTQEELNAIVGDRLQRERQKYADYETLKEKAGKYDEQVGASKSDLERAQDAVRILTAELEGLKSANSKRDLRLKVSKETGVPEDLLTADTEEDLKAQAQKLLEFRGKPTGVYPTARASKSSGASSDGNSAWIESARQIFGNNK